MKKILIIFGICQKKMKASLLVNIFRQYSDISETSVRITEHHAEMPDHVLQLLEIVFDFDLKIMKKVKDLYDIISVLLTKMRMFLVNVSPACVVLTDNTERLGAAEAVKVGFIERCYDMIVEEISAFWLANLCTMQCPEPISYMEKVPQVTKILNFLPKN